MKKKQCCKQSHSSSKIKIKKLNQKPTVAFFPSVVYEIMNFTLRPEKFAQIYVNYKKKTKKNVPKSIKIP